MDPKKNKNYQCLKILTKVKGFHPTINYWHFWFLVSLTVNIKPKRAPTKVIYDRFLEPAIQRMTHIDLITDNSKRGPGATINLEMSYDLLINKNDELSGYLIFCSVFQTCFYGESP